MEEQKEQKIQNFRREVERLDVKPFDSEAVDYCIGALRLHGCIVSISSDRYTVFFPKGTIQEEILPRAFDTRYRILFPDGFEIGSVVRRGSDLHLFMMPKSILPRRLQEKYSH